MIGFLSRLFGGVQEPEQADLFPPTEPYAPTPESMRAAQEQLDAVEPVSLEEWQEGGQE